MLVPSSPGGLSEPEPTGTVPAAGSDLPWIRVADGAPYFVDDAGASWTPVGQNDALTWPELAGLFGRRDLGSVERHLLWLKSSGVTVLRLMLEYCHHDGAFLERPAGTFVPEMVQAWDDLVALCRRVGLRLLLTPFDTFFTWNHWDRHPYNRENGGPCAGRDQLLTCPATRAFIKRRLAFAASRWGGDGVVFAWDVWNELHPAQGENRPTCFQDYIDDVSPHLRDLERRLHGRAHLQTASVFGPELAWKPWLNEPIFRHPLLDFANSHFYEEGTIDHPADTVAPAVSVGRLVREALAEIADARPFFDSEHGPIHTFKDHNRTLGEAFDDEYFRHIQWAHLASGAAGGGMRWPNRHPHVLTRGMRQAQQALAAFLPLIDWSRFRRRPLWGEAAVSDPAVHLFACGDGRQAVLYLLRGDSVGEAGLLRPDAPPLSPVVTLPDLESGCYRVTCWNTRGGRALGTAEVRHDGGETTLPIEGFATDMAVAVRRVEEEGRVLSRPAWRGRTPPGIPGR